MKNALDRFSTSHATLIFLAAITWHIGFIVLLLKGGALLIEAQATEPLQSWHIYAAICGLLLGAVKAVFIFNTSCRKNLARIAALTKPKLWQFFRPGFFVCLAAMVVLGANLSRLSSGNYPMLLGVAMIDLSVGFALLFSSTVFWKSRK